MSSPRERLKSNQGQNDRRDAVPSVDYTIKLYQFPRVLMDGHASQSFVECSIFCKEWFILLGSEFSILSEPFWSCDAWPYEVPEKGWLKNPRWVILNFHKIERERGGEKRKQIFIKNWKKENLSFSFFQFPNHRKGHIKNQAYFTCTVRNFSQEPDNDDIAAPHRHPHIPNHPSRDLLRN